MKDWERTQACVLLQMEAMKPGVFSFPSVIFLELSTGVSFANLPSDCSASYLIDSFFVNKIENAVQVQKTHLTSLGVKSGQTYLGCSTTS